MSDRPTNGVPPLFTPEELLAIERLRETKRAEQQAAARVSAEPQAERAPERPSSTAIGDWLPKLTFVKCQCGRAEMLKGSVRCGQCHADAQQSAAARDHRRLSLASIPNGYEWAHLDYDRLPARAWPGVLDKARRVLERPPRSLVLLGFGRTGKTSLAVAMLKHEIERTQLQGRMLFTLAHRLGVARIQWPAGRGEARDVEAAMQAELCVIDDVGSERPTATNPLPDVVFERDAEARRTWYTIGQPSIDEARKYLISKYGDGVCGRVFDDADVIVLGKS